MKLSLNKLHVQQLLEPTRGATVIKASCIKTAFINMHSNLAKEAQGLHSKFKTPPQSNLISHYQFLCLNPKEAGSSFVEFAMDLEDSLQRELSSFFEIEDPIRFDDLYLTAYSASEMGVGPHRDTNCKNLVATLVLTGDPAFYICKDKEQSGSIAIHAQAGDLLLMRAEGFQGLSRPYHYVGQTNGFLQLGFRQYKNPPPH